MWDVKAAFIQRQGVAAGKVRVLWHEGRLRCFNVTGLVLDIQSEQPTRKPMHLRTWIANTEHGEVTIKEKCWTCGGWWRIASKPAEDLWRQGEDRSASEVQRCGGDSTED